MLCLIDTVQAGQQCLGVTLIPTSSSVNGESGHVFISDAVPYALQVWSLGCVGARLSISLDTSSSSTGLELDHYWMNYTQVCSIISMMICTLYPTTKTRPRVKLAFVPALGQESAVVAQMVSPSRSYDLGEDDLVIPHLDLGSPGNSSSRYELQPGDTVLVHEAETASASLTRAKHWAMSLVIPEGSLSDSVSLVVSKKGGGSASSIHTSTISPPSLTWPLFFILE